MACDRSELAEYLDYLTARLSECGEKLPEHAQAMSSAAHHAVGVLLDKECAEVEDFYKAQGALNELVYLLKKSCEKEGEETRLAALSIMPAGCFLPFRKQVCGLTFGPGCYIMDGEDVSHVSYDAAQQQETVYHELTHAYLSFHKEKRIDCKWVEEGLAEYAAKKLRYDPDPATGGSGIPANEVSRHEYYNFLRHIRTLRPVEVNALAQDYVLARKGSPYWCRLVRSFQKT